MKTRGFERIFLVAIALLAASMFLTPWAMAQEGTQGQVVVTVVDPSGAVVPGADLKIVEHGTNNTYTASTNGSGAYTFVNLPVGTYTLTVSHSGYTTKVFSAVAVQATRSTSVNAPLAIGQATQTVTVTTQASAALQTTSNEIGQVVDQKEIQDLPLAGRDITALSTIVPGYTGQNGQGTYDGLPIEDAGQNMDGMVGNTSRMKFDSSAPAVSPRLEDIEQMSVQTDQLGLDAGFGQASTQVTFVTKRGTNQFHGLAYEDFRNDGLDANSWENDATGNRKSKLIENDFGGSVGGPILHNKLFFFGTYAERKIPGAYPVTNYVFTSGAQQGNFTYTGTDGNNHTVNLMSIAANNNLPSAVNADTAKAISAINSSVGSGHLAGTSDPNVQSITWNNSSPETDYFPVARIDYNLSQKTRMYLSWMMTELEQPGNTAPTFPGSGFANQQAGNLTKNFVATYGFDYIFSPRLINQLKVGFLYDVTKFAYNAAPLYVTQPSVTWNYSGFNFPMSGQAYQLPINTYYPIYDFTDSMTLQHGKHTFGYGLSWYKEQDHYWNAPGGFYNYSLGLASGDPAINAFTNGSGGSVPDATQAELSKADSLYAILVGRLSGVSGENSYNIKTGNYAPTGTMSEYPLDEVSSAWSFFGQDSWRITPTLTLNYGLRWDIFGPEKDLTGQYHSADEAAIYGPTPVGHLFQPGDVSGDTNPVIGVHDQPYAPWRVTPQPAFGFAWNPRVSSGPLAGLLGGNGTVIRGGYALRRFTEPYQYFWDDGTDYGSFYYQFFNVLANNTGQPGTFAPGSLALGDALPAPILSPAGYQATAPEAEFTYNGGPGVNGIQPNLDEPESESWNFGIQREIGHSRVLEVRYNGNHTLHQWIAIDPNEVNIFENKFLTDFKNAQANLAAYEAANPGCQATSTCSFQGATGSMPIIEAAFGPSDTSDFTNTQFVNYLNTGQAGSFAGTLAGINGTVPYFCNLVGAGFAPCANNAGYTGAGAGYPINFFQANPYAGGSSSGELVSEGYSNYNGLQVDFRQSAWHGLQYDANFTWAHSLGVQSGNAWTGAYNGFTLRDMRKSYGPTIFDLRHAFHLSGTYDLPFGRGRSYLSGNRALDALVGGYTIGTIVTWQSGAPAYLAGGYSTFNDYGDGGIAMHGVTAKQLQSSIGVREVKGQSYADFLNPKYMVSPTGGGANSAYLTPNTTPGTFGQISYINAPKQFSQDIEVTKAFPIHETLHFELQAAFINAWNHPIWGNADGFGPYVPGAQNASFDSGLQDYNFGTGTPTNENSGLLNGLGRQIELRGNFRF